METMGADTSRCLSMGAHSSALLLIVVDETM